MTESKGWSTPGKGIFVPNVSTLIDKLEPGMYDPGYSPQVGYFLQRTELANQKIIKFADSTSEAVIKDIQNFWTVEDRFRKFKFPYKRGILMFGPPGGGKSSTIFLICKEVIKQNGIVLKFNRYDWFTGSLRLLKQVQPEMPVVALMEDLDEIISENSLSNILNLLDGVEQGADRIVYLATTNRPDRLHENIKNRPSRFDRKFQFGAPSLVARKQYLESLFLEEKHSNDLNKWAKDSKGFSFAHLKELFISVELFKNNYKDALKVLKDMSKSAEELDEEMLDDDD
ncbi:MAG TPA: AAA family ATPase [Anaerovoracaceae bacterium]|nr:AAA family ATPase [Anaerovoracaceae bacterium]